MSQLTRSRLTEITNSLDKSVFTVAAFEVTSGGNNNDVISITYRDDPTFRARLFYGIKSEGGPFDMASLMKRERVLCSEFSPGNFMVTETVEGTRFEKFVEELLPWTHRLRSEITLLDVLHRQFEDFQTELNAKLEKHFADSKTRLSEEEKNDVFSRLEEFQKRIEELEKTKQATNVQVEELKKIITELTQSASVMPQKAWYRAAISRIFTFGSKLASSPAGQKAIETTMERLLSGPKAS